MRCEIVDSGHCPEKRRNHRRSLAASCASTLRAATAACLGLLALGGPDLRAAESTAASAYVTGFAHKGKNGKQTYKILTHVAYAPDPGLPGGIAAFGIPDGGSVVLLTFTPYVPSLSPAGASREVMTTKPPLDAPQLPRFVMVCAWPLEGEKPGQAVAGFAELDEANMTILPEKYFVGISAMWVEIPANRAPDAFSRHDYCGEIATTGKSAAPWWLRDRKR